MHSRGIVRLVRFCFCVPSPLCLGFFPVQEKSQTNIALLVEYDSRSHFRGGTCGEGSNPRALQATASCPASTLWLPPLQVDQTFRESSHTWSFPISVNLVPSFRSIFFMNCGIRPFSTHNSASVTPCGFSHKRATGTSNSAAEHPTRNWAVLRSPANKASLFAGSMGTPNQNPKHI